MNPWPDRAGFTVDHDAFRDSVRRFVAREVAPHLDTWRESGGAPPSFYRAAGEQGLLATAAPEALGGGGVDDPRFVAVLVEELATCGAVGVAHVVALHSGVCLPLVLEYGSSTAVSTRAPGLIDGSVLTVPVGAGSALHVGTSDDRDDVIGLGGAAVGVPGATGAGLVLAQVIADGHGSVATGAHEPLLVLAEPPSRAGFSPVRDALGGRDAGQADLDFDGVTASSLDVLASPAAARLPARLDVWAAVVATAATRAVLDLTLRYVADRRVFGRPLAQFANTRHRLAELSGRLAATRVLVDACLAGLADGGLSDAAAAAARLDAGQVHDQAVDLGIQLHGGYGYMREYPISHAYADAQYLRDQERAGSVAWEKIAVGLGL